MNGNATAKVYVITCSATSKVYVGSSVKPRIRLKDHWVILTKGCHENSYLQRAWNKYGAEQFSWKIVETCPEDQRWIREQWWIDELRACDRRFGYNAMHSVRGLTPSPIMSKKLKAYWKVRWKDPAYKEKRTQELSGLSKKPGVAEKMRASKLAAWQDPEYREKQSVSRRKAALKNSDKLRARAKSLWEDPEYRAKQMAERKKRFQDPAFRAKLSEAAANRPPRAKWYILTHS